MTMVKIIVIEDEAHIREEVMEWLQFEGYHIVGAPNGRMGLAAIQREQPELILCDVSMPEMDGHEVLIAVRSDPDLSHIPFVFLTASADRDAIRKGMNLGADDYLTKPFTHSEVLNAIRSILQKKALLDSRVQNQMNSLNMALTEEREKRLLKSRLVAMFSHDFRNPLTSILSSSSILRNYNDRLTPERKQQQFDRIDGSVHLLIQMLDEMLVAAEIEGGHLELAPELVDLTVFIEPIIEEFRLIDHDAHQFLFQSTLNTPIMGDPKLLRHIISNLISNAIKYSPSQTQITIFLMGQDGVVQLIVEDQGIGIPDESLSHLFEPFHRAANARSVKGTGLGLSIAKQAIDLHGGSITVESVVNQGTRFMVYLPSHLPQERM